MTTYPPAPTPYVLEEELRQLLDIPTTDDATDVDTQRALDAGRAWIDWFTGRTFGAGPAGTERVYPATTEDAVDVVDLQSTAPTIEVDTAGDRTYATTLVPAQYAFEPVSGPPFHTILAWPVPAGGVAPIVFEPGQLVRVTGQWGYTDSRGRIPANVAQANLLLGARLYKRRELPLGTLESQQLDVFQRITDRDPDVVAMLFPVCRPGSPGAALASTAFPGASLTGGSAWVMV